MRTSLDEGCSGAREQGKNAHLKTLRHKGWGIGGWLKMRRKGVTWDSKVPHFGGDGGDNGRHLSSGELREGVVESQGCRGLSVSLPCCLKTS